MPLLDNIELTLGLPEDELDELEDVELDEEELELELLELLELELDELDEVVGGSPPHANSVADPSTSPVSFSAR